VIFAQCAVKLTLKICIHLRRRGHTPVAPVPRSATGLTNLLEFLEFVREAVDRGELVNVIYLDFQKAFDKVPHVRLLEKIRAHGIMGKILNWLENRLKGRQRMLF